MEKIEEDIGLSEIIDEINKYSKIVNMLMIIYLVFTILEIVFFLLKFTIDLPIIYAFIGLIVLVLLMLIMAIFAFKIRKIAMPLIKEKEAWLNQFKQK